MNQIVTMPAERRELKKVMPDPKKDLGIQSGRLLLIEAFARVVRDNPGITSQSERFKLAKALALDAAKESVRYLKSNISMVEQVFED